MGKTDGSGGDLGPMRVESLRGECLCKQKVFARQRSGVSKRVVSVLSPRGAPGHLPRPLPTQVFRIKADRNPAKSRLNSFRNTILLKASLEVSKTTLQVVAGSKLGGGVASGCFFSSRILGLQD